MERSPLCPREQAQQEDGHVWALGVGCHFGRMLVGHMCAPLQIPVSLSSPGNRLEATPFPPLQAFATETQLSMWLVMRGVSHAALWASLPSSLGRNSSPRGGAACISWPTQPVHNYSTSPILYPAQVLFICVTLIKCDLHFSEVRPISPLMAEEAVAQRSNSSRERQGRWSSSMSDPNLHVFNLFCTWPVFPETLCVP